MVATTDSYSGLVRGFLSHSHVIFLLVLLKDSIITWILCVVNTLHNHFIYGLSIS